MHLHQTAKIRFWTRSLTVKTFWIRVDMLDSGLSHHKWGQLADGFRSALSAAVSYISAGIRGRKSVCAAFALRRPAIISAMSGVTWSEFFELEAVPVDPIKSASLHNSLFFHYYHNVIAYLKPTLKLARHRLAHRLLIACSGSTFAGHRDHLTFEYMFTVDDWTFCQPTFSIKTRI